MSTPFSLERPGLGPAFIYMAIEGVIFTVLTVLLEVCDETENITCSILLLLKLLHTCTEKVLLPSNQSKAFIFKIFRQISLAQ